MNIALLNGWNMHADMWQSLLPCLQAYGDVVDVDYAKVADVDDEQYAKNQDPQTIIDVFCEHIYQQLPKPCVLVGWSLGGMLATHIAARYPQSIIGLVTLATNVQFVASDQWAAAMPANVFDNFYDTYGKDPHKTEKYFAQLVVKGDAYRREQHRYLQTNTLHQSAQKKQGVIGLSLLRHIKNQTALQGIDCPSLHVFGEHDALVPASTVVEIQQLQVNKSNTQCHIIANAGHLLHMPENRLPPFIDDFLQRCQHECGNESR